MIEINVTNVSLEKKFLDPIECFGAEHGKIFQQYNHGEPTKDYLLGAGHHERPILIWWDNEENKYKLSSDSKKELKSLYDHVKYLEVNGEISMELILNNDIPRSA